jgi:hypothetical protein
MNGRTARKLRKMAAVEMYTNKENVPRELVVATIKGHDRVINEPMSTRAMYRHLKTAYRASMRRKA